MIKHFTTLLFFFSLGISSQLLAVNCDAADAAGVASCAAMAATTSITITANNADIEVTSPADLDLRGITVNMVNNSLTLPSGTQVDAGTSFNANGQDGVTVSVGNTAYSFNNNGGGNPAPTGTLAELNAAIANGAMTLGDAALAAAGVLPVSLLSFDAQAMDKKVMLTWTVAEESGNEAFELSVSDDGVHYQTVQTVAGRGDASEAHTYEVSDVPTTSGDLYYRLTQRDFSGVTRELGVRTVRWDAASAATLSAFPNPTNAGQMIRLRGVAGVSTVDLLGMTGQLVRQLDVTDGQAMLPGDIAAGIYLLRATGQDSKPVRLVIR